MAEFRQGVLTTKGLQLISLVQSGQADIQFTGFEIGSGDWGESPTIEQLQAAESLLNSKGDFPISKVEYVNPATTKLTLLASNQSNTSGGYYITEVGIFAKWTDDTEFLYAIYVTEKDKADWFPAFNSITPSSIHYNVPITVANAANVTIDTTRAGLATQAEVNELRGEIEQTQDDLDATNGDIADLKAFVNYNSDNDIYGVEVDFRNKRFTRLGGAVNKKPGRDFDDINAFGGRRRCNLADNGTVNAYEGDSGYVEDGTNGQVMVEQPKFYYKVVPLETETIGSRVLLRKARYYVSDTAKTGFKLHPAFIMNGQELNKVYVSAYEATTFDVSANAYITDDAQTVDFNNDKGASIAGAKPASGKTQTGATRDGFRKVSAKRGTGWSQGIIQTASMTQLLFLVEYASFNAQANIGRGNVDKTDDGSSNMSENTGATSSLGNESGAIRLASGIELVTYRGEENFWGNIWTWIDGINVHAGRIYIADHGFADDTTSGYTDTGIVCINANGYISAFVYAENFDWLFIPGEVLGSSALPVSDHFWQNVAQNDWRVAMLGARWADGSRSGAFCLALDHVSSGRGRDIGGRLVYRKAA